MEIAYNRLVELLTPAVADSEKRSALLEKLAHILGTSGAILGSTPEEQLHSIFAKTKEITGTVSIKIAHLFGKSDAEVFDAVMQDTRAALEKGQAAAPKATRTKKVKETPAAKPRYGSTSPIAAARGGRHDHKLG